MNKCTLCIIELQGDDINMIINKAYRFRLYPNKE